LSIEGIDGALDELTEALTFIQTGKIENFPVVLIGVDYWRDFQQMLARMAIEGTIAASDLELMLVTDDISEAMAHIRRHAVEPFGLRRVVIRPTPLLGEPAPLTPA
jgi:predicted Rossmann-fold nucleotide-binding protein